MSDPWVFDTSALVQMKTAVAGPDQWEAFRRLETMVEEGSLALCRQAIKEASEVAFPDVPGAWAAAMRKKVRHPLDIEYAYVATVMTRVPNLVDPNETREIADPYVIAQAMALAADGHQPIVVTHESVDRPPLVCMRTACDRLDVPVLGLEPFLDAVGIRYRPPRSAGSP